MDKKLKRTIIMLICIVGLVFFSMVFQVLDIPLPFLPSFVRLQFSVVLALVGALAYGPLVGAFIVLAKEFFYFWLTGCAFAEILSNSATDLLFVIIASAIYINIKGGTIKKVNKNGETHRKIVTRKKRILISGSIATIIVVLLTAVLAKYVDVAVLTKYTELTTEAMISEYSQIAGIKDINTGILSFYVPVAFVEYGFATVFVACIYKKISGFLHGKFVS